MTRITLLSIGVLWSAALSAGAQEDMHKNTKDTVMNKTVALVIAHNNFQPIEYGTTKDVLEKNGISVVTLSDGAGQATATDRSTVPVDKTVDLASADDYDGIFLIGGAGALKHLDTPAVHALFKDAVAKNKAWGAICISPRILAHATLLAGHTITGWDGDSALDALCKEYKITRSRKSVVTDGRLVTADGPSSATGFGQAIVEIVKS